MSPMSSPAVTVTAAGDDRYTVRVAGRTEHRVTARPEVLRRVAAAGEPPEQTLQPFLISAFEGVPVLSTLFAGAAGIMIAPLFNVHSDMGTVFGLKAFAVAILGGITSAWGVMLAGLLFGVVESLITALLGSAYTQILTFTLVIAALALMPHGLFGRAELKKV